MVMAEWKEWVWMQRQGRFDQKHLGFPMRSNMHVTGGFDLPVWISNEYDIRKIRVTRPNGLKLVEP